MEHGNGNLNKYGYGYGWIYDAYDNEILYTKHEIRNMKYEIYIRWDGRNKYTSTTLAHEFPLQKNRKIPNGLGVFNFTVYIVLLLTI